HPVRAPGRRLRPHRTDHRGGGGRGRLHLPRGAVLRSRRGVRRSARQAVADDADQPAPRRPPGADPGDPADPLPRAPGMAAAHHHLPLQLGGSGLRSGRGGQHPLPGQPRADPGRHVPLHDHSIFTLLLGSVLAPICLILFGYLVPFYIAAGLFALAALSCWRIGAPLRAVEAGAGPQSHVFREFQDGIGILRRGPALRWGMIQLGLALIMVFTIYALGAPYLQKVLHRSPNDISIVLGPAMVGLVAMAGVLGQHLITLSRRSISVIAFITTGTCLVAMGVLPPVFQHLGITGLVVPAVVFLALVFGCALGAILIPSFT